jgi:hypothetical protein
MATSLRQASLRVAAGSACAVVPWKAFDPDEDMKWEQEKLVGVLIAGARLIRVDRPVIVVNAKVAAIQPRSSSDPSVRLVGRGAIQPAKRHVELDLDEFQQ